MKKFFQDFKEFAVKGSVVDLAIGVVIGTAFNKIVSSLVKDIIMPPFGLLWDDQHLSKYKWILREGTTGADGQEMAAEVAITYGQFLEAALDFLIIGLSIFIVIRFVNTLKRKAEDTQEKSVPTPKDIQLLTEIRDLLKDRK